MKKLLIAAVVGALSSSIMLAATDAAAQPATATAKKAAATPKKPAPKHRIIKRKPNPAKEARVDAIPAGAEHWSCAEGMAFDLKGDMARDQIVVVHWANKNYNLPRQITTTGADRFHDSATGLDLVVIPTKAMLFSDHDGSRLADECKTVAMQQGAMAPTQAVSLDPANRAPAAASAVSGQ
jgi:hypothetical protein